MWLLTALVRIKSTKSVASPVVWNSKTISPSIASGRSNTIDASPQPSYKLSIYSESELNILIVLDSTTNSIGGGELKEFSFRKTAEFSAPSATSAIASFIWYVKQAVTFAVATKGTVKPG